jgi:TM2 domain-containing membrane protein YozV
MTYPPEPPRYPPNQPPHDPYRQADQYPGQFSPEGQYQHPMSPGYQVPGMYDPRTGLIFSERSKMIAGLLQILLGAFGAGRFYTGHHGIAIAQLVVTLLTCGIGSLWGLIDGILILVNGGTDAEGNVLRDSG